MSENPFIREVRANPLDHTPRLIYADFLEETGDPQGELIRVQVQLAQLPTGDPGGVPLEHRERELLAQHAERWLAPLRALGADGVSARCFQCGLIERVRLSVSEFLRHGERLCEISPALYCLDLRKAWDAEALTELAPRALPRQITSLDLGANRLRTEGAAIFSSAAWTAQISELNLQFNQLDDDAIAQLVRVPWPELRRLQLGANVIGPRGAALLANWAAMQRLEKLSLNLNRLGNEGVRRFTRSNLLSRLRELDLASNDLLRASAVALSEARNLTSLESLNLRANQLKLLDLQTLCDSPHLTALREIDARNNAFTAGESPLPGGRLSQCRVLV